MQTCKLYINGEFIDADDGRTFESRNPYDNSITAIAARAGTADVEKAVDSAHQAFYHGAWRHSNPEQRAAVICQIADGIRTNLIRLVQCEIADAGATRKKAADDVMSSIAFLEQYAKIASDFNQEQSIAALNNKTGKHYLHYEPIGVCAAIIPWNFPLKMALWKLAPALATGNTVVLKPSELTPLSAQILAEIIADTDLPPGVVNIIPGLGNEAGQALIENPRVNKIAFTGSTATGRTIMTNAASTLKRLTLECGGKSANIVLDDTPDNIAVDAAIYAMFYHSGQCCEAGSRLFLPDSRYDELLDKLSAKIKLVSLGDPALGSTDMGPLISARQREQVLTAIDTAIQEGAHLVCGGSIPADLNSGWFVMPTVFADVDATMSIVREEIFGPVLCVLRYHDEQDLIDKVNACDYGLVTGIWTTDTMRAASLAEHLQSGSVWVNDYHCFDAHAPFGGFKQSGLGREFGEDGLKAYTEIKYIALNELDPPALARRFKTIVPN